MKKILLVDDMEITNFITIQFIQHINPQYSVYDFTEPEKAITQVNDINPDVIFLDLNMPVMDGWEFLEQMQQQQMQHKVYILTSSTSDLDRKRAENFNNVAGYLVKPLETTLLDDVLASL
ncbi:response regulator [Pontibacter populi]|uniref:Response regulator n=1 Tax=Pontibacter populi TaxID=890055 RepID=A0ABV1RU43_9BACT